MLFSHRHWAGSRPATTPSSHPRRTASLRFIAVVGCALLGNGAMALPRPSAAWGQTVASATVTEVLDSDQVFIQNRQAAVNSVAQRQQRVRTQSARTSLRFNNGAVARLAHNSSLMVGQCAQLSRGTLLVNGSLNGCSTTTMAGVRGTLYTLEVTEEGETTVKVFEGEVLVGQRSTDLAPDEGLTPEEDVDTEEASGANEDSDADGNEGDEDGLKQVFDQADSATPTEDPQNPGHNDSAPQPQPQIDLSAPSGDDGKVEPAETVLVIREGQQVMINAESDLAVISRLTVDDFINLVEGPLVQGFSDLPGISDLQRVFHRLYPRVPSLPPILSVPSLIIPQPPTNPPTSPTYPPISPGPLFP